MKRPWDVQLWLENSPGLTLHSKLLSKLIDDIQKGRLAPGSLLPGSRSLARQHSINRKTVQSVYEELVAQGWLIARQGSGTYVSDVLPEKGLTKSYEKLLSGSDQPETTSKLLEVLSKDARDHRDNVVISNDGTPDPRLIPYELLSRTYRRVCRGLSQKFSLGYGDPKGTQEVRRAICKMLKDDRFMNCTVDQVCIVRGSQMGIYLASKVLDPSKGVIVMEELCYRLAKAAFESNGFTVVLCKLDSQGLNIECLKNIIKNHDVAAIYVTPHHQYPTTLCLHMDRRLALLELSRSFGFAILEDDYDHEFHYETNPMPPLASLPNSQNVVYIGSMSKVLAPGLRLGYMKADKAFIDRVAQEVLVIDRQGNPVSELVLSDLMTSGEVKRHIRKIRQVYKTRRDFAAHELTRVFGESVDFNLPAGGMAIWVDMSRIAKDVFPDRYENKDISLESLFSSEEIYSTHFRFGFGALNEHEITQSIENLSHILKQ